jgi:hypothetical protein
VAKLPEPPPVATLRLVSPDVETLPAGTRLWRIYFRGGSHPATWDQMSARFDHHLDPPKVQNRGPGVDAGRGRSTTLTLTLAACITPPP